MMVESSYPISTLASGELIPVETNRDGENRESSLISKSSVLEKSDAR